MDNCSEYSQQLTCSLVISSWVSSITCTYKDPTLLQRLEMASLSSWSFMFCLICFQSLFTQCLRMQSSEFQPPFIPKAVRVENVPEVRVVKFKV